MLGISFNELIVILLLMVIFVKPKDIPSVVNAIAKFWRHLKNFIFEIQTQIRNITDEIDDTKNETFETFHDKVERVRLEIEKQASLDLDIFDDDFNKKTPKLKIEQPKQKTKKK